MVVKKYGTQDHCLVRLVVYFVFKYLLLFIILKIFN